MCQKVFLKQDKFGEKTVHPLFDKKKCSCTPLKKTYGQHYSGLVTLDMSQGQVCICQDLKQLTDTPFPTITWVY